MSTSTRVLVLHGYSQNAIVFSKRLGALRKERSDIEYVFINAPHILLAAELFGSERPTGVDTQADLNTALRGWWKADREKKIFQGFDDSLTLIASVLKEQRFDGIFGFSQGAAFAAIITALLERPQLNPLFSENDKPIHPPFKFCVAVSGFRLEVPICDPIFSSNFTTPTLHVIGRTDVVVVEERSRQLVEVSANARVEEHDGGHFVPSKGNWRKFLVNYMVDPTGPHPSPSAMSAMSTYEPSSGTSTPGGSGGSYKDVLLMKL